MFSALGKAPMHTFRNTSRFPSPPRFYTSGTHPVTTKCKVGDEVHACGMGIFFPSLPITEKIDQKGPSNKIKASSYNDSPFNTPEQQIFQDNIS